MSNIERIEKLKHPGVLRNFTWPGDMRNFGHYNLIYGWNGSGKTTISKIFRAVEKKEPPESECDVVLSINGNHVNGSDFEQTTLPVRVFNRDFIENNVFRTDDAEVPPILVLGEDSVQKQKELDLLKKNLVEAEAKLETKRINCQVVKRSLDQHNSDRARTIKNTLRSPGRNPYNNYDKSDYKKHAKKMTSNGDAKNYILDNSEHQRLLARHKDQPKPKIAEMSYQFPCLLTHSQEVSQLLEITVVSEIIQSLKEDQELSSWIHKGLDLHDSRKTGKCLFCEQKLPENRLARLNAHFSTEYERLLRNVDLEIENLQQLLRLANDVSTPIPAQFYDDLAEDYEDIKSRLDEALNTTKVSLNNLVKSLQNKQERVFESYTLDIPMPQVESGLVESVNIILKRHNVRCDDFETQVAEAREHLANDSVARSSEEFGKLLQVVNESESAVNEASSEVAQLKKKITEIELDIVEHRKPAEELNDDIQKYLGHNELQLDVKETGYEITRNGTPAEALSEGETTAIALLYFLKSLQDQNFDLENGVVVLDDPVSSLDANALYLAFGFIKERTQNSAQLFILTHNFSFFRQVRNWFHHLRGQRKRDPNQRPARFYMLEWKFNQRKRSSALRWLDPLLEQYESDYHYLFARIYREYQEAQEAQAAELEEYYVLPNMARRLLEGFLAFRRPQVAGDLWNKLKDVDFDEAKKTRILRFLHTHSHNDSIGQPEHDPSPLGETPSVLKDLLELMKSQDNEHFNAMVELANTSQEENNDE